MRGIPGMQVFCPADDEELVGGAARVLASRAPATSATTRAPAVAHRTPFALGRAEVARATGDDVALLTYGFLLARGGGRAAAHPRGARRAACASSTCARSTPLDEDADPGRRARDRGSLVTLEDHFRDRRALLDRRPRSWCGTGVAPRVLPIALDERWFQPGAPARRARARGLHRRARSPSAILEALWTEQPIMPNGVALQRAAIPIDRARPNALLRARRGPDPRRHADAGQGPGPVRARRRAQVPAARPGRARLGRRRQRVPRLQHGASARSRSATRYPAVDEAIRGQLEDGITFSLMHPLEVEVAELRARASCPGAESRALRQDRRRRHERGRAPGPRLHRPRQGALLRLPRLARLVHRASPTAAAGVPEAVARPHLHRSPTTTSPPRERRSTTTPRA